MRDREALQQARDTLNRELHEAQFGRRVARFPESA